MADEPFLLKDMLTRDTVAALASCIAHADERFDPDAFVADVFDESWSGLELKQRTRHITATMAIHLPSAYPDALAVLLAAARTAPELGWEAMSFSDFVDVYGLDDPGRSIPALAEFTKLASAEFAVRPFILAYPDRMYATMLAWTGDDDWRVRRLASEGCRPRLPWGMALKPLQADPAQILPILSALRLDESEDVRRSVANNLNDIAKDHPDVVIDVLTEWQDGEAETAALTRHALRTLLKRGDPDALRLMGQDPDAPCVADGFRVDPGSPMIGDKARFHVTLVSEASTRQSFRIDLVVGFLKANGSRSRKVFTVKTIDLDPGESVDLSRLVTFEQLSTRRVHPGTHAAAIQVNGAERASIHFEVVGPV